jgi:hypothetical protein
MARRSSMPCWQFCQKAQKPSSLPLMRDESNDRIRELKRMGNIPYNGINSIILNSSWRRKLDVQDLCTTFCSLNLSVIPIPFNLKRLQETQDLPMIGNWMARSKISDEFRNRIPWCSRNRSFQGQNHLIRVLQAKDSCRKERNRRSSWSGIDLQISGHWIHEW